MHRHHEWRNLSRRQPGGELIPPITQAPTPSPFLCLAPARLPPFFPLPLRTWSRNHLNYRVLSKLCVKCCSCCCFFVFLLISLAWKASWRLGADWEDKEVKEPFSLCYYVSFEGGKEKQILPSSSASPSFFRLAAPTITRSPHILHMRTGIASAYHKEEQKSLLHKHLLLLTPKPASIVHLKISP